MVAFEDETWTQLYPRIEAKWMKKGQQEKILTPGYNRRKNVFVTLLWPKKYGFVWNRFEKRRRSREFKLHLSNLIQYAKRHGVKRIILFTDHATCHKTKNVKRFIRDHDENPQDKDATQESSAAEPHGMGSEQATKVRRLLEPIIQEHGRSRQEYDTLPQTT